MARHFFALWPDRHSREALAAHGARVVATAGGRVVPAANLHLTLAFLGEVAPARLDLLHEAALGVDAAAFELGLDEVGCFRRTQVAWAGCRVTPLPLLGLQAALAARLRARGFPLEDRPFAPHLTLARRIAAPIASEPISPVTWRVTAFVLVESRRDRGEYATVGQWPLREETG